MSVAAIVNEFDYGTGTAQPFPGQQVNAQPQLIDVNLVQSGSAAAGITAAAGAASGASTGAALGGSSAGSFPG